MNGRNWLKEYCEKTTSHCIEYFVMKRRALIEKCFWTLTFFLLMSLTFTTMLSLLNTWINSPSVIFIENRESEIKEIPFPLITICPSYQLRAWVWDKHKSSNTSYWKNLQQYRSLICSLSHYSPVYNIHHQADYVQSDLIKTFIKDCAISCSEIFQDNYVKWQDITIRNFCKYVQPIISPLGICYTINMLPTYQIFNDKYYQRYMDFFSKNNSYGLTERTKWNLDDGYSSYNDDNLLNVNPVRTNGVTYYNSLSFTLNVFQDIFLKCPNVNLLYGYYLIDNAIGISDDQVAVFDCCFLNINTFLHISSSYSLVVNMFDKEYVSDELYFVLRHWYHSGFSDLGYQTLSLPIRITISNPTEYYSIKSRSFVVPYTDTKIQIIPYVKKISSDLMWRSLDVRKCYLHNERKLAIFQHYSQKNCDHECVINETISTCGCIRFEWAFLTTTSDLKICGLAKKYCMKKSLESALRPEMLSQCKCLPTCSTLEYEITDSSDWAYDKASELSNNSFTGAQVEIVFNRSDFTAYKSASIVDLNTLISIIGGVISLLLGFNLVNFFEILYVVLQLVINCFMYMFNKNNL